MQCLVKDSKLTVQDSPKVCNRNHLHFGLAIGINDENNNKFQSELPGFYDPCVGEEKSLKIEFTYNGIPQTHTIKDKDPLRLPINVNNAGSIFTLCSVWIRLL